MGIWDDKPVEEAQIVEEPKVEVKKEGLPVRNGGDRIWLLKGGKKYWITNAETYSKLGFKFGDERDIDDESLALFPEGEPIRI